EKFGHLIRRLSEDGGKGFFGDDRAPHRLTLNKIGGHAGDLTEGNAYAVHKLLVLNILGVNDKGFYPVRNFLEGDIVLGKDLNLQFIKRGAGGTLAQLARGASILLVTPEICRLALRLGGSVNEVIEDLGVHGSPERLLKPGDRLFGGVEGGHRIEAVNLNFYHVRLFGIFL